MGLHSRKKTCNIRYDHLKGWKSSYEMIFDHLIFQNKGVKWIPIQGLDTLLKISSQGLQLYSWDILICKQILKSCGFKNWKASLGVSRKVSFWCLSLHGKLIIRKKVVTPKSRPIWCMNLMSTKWAITHLCTMFLSPNYVN